MTTNAEKISAWRKANPYDTLSGPLLRKLLSLTTLRGANLSYAPLRKADLWDEDLQDTNLGGADLTDVELDRANLAGVNLEDANLADSNHWGGMPISTPSGDGYLIPTPDGWRITIGCWRNRTLDELRDLIEDRAEWPEARGTLRERRRPILAAVLNLAEAHTEYHAHLVPALAKKWNTK